MKLVNLGKQDTPVLLFGGPYSNLHATQALRGIAAHRGIAPDAVICTGDVVAYCADAVATVAEIRDWGCHVVAGNCEKQLADSAEDCGCGFEEGSVCDGLSATWFDHANRRIAPEDRAWMRTCPDMTTFEQAGRSFAVIHGGLSDISRFLWATSSTSDFREEINLIEQTIGPVDGVISGHSGLAFERHIDGVSWINAGVIGMPPNNGGRDTEYVVLTDGTAQIHSLAYDALAAHDAMVREGLTQGYRTGLTGGIWPSQ